MVFLVSFLYDIHVKKYNTFRTSAEMSSPGAPFRDNPEAGAPEPNGIDNDFQVSLGPFTFCGTFRV